MNDTVSLILPVAGESNRFPGMKPKWLLTHPSGNLMIVEAIAGLDLSRVERIYLVALSAHEAEYGFMTGIRQQFEEFDLLDRLEVVLLDTPTKSQPETVARAIEQCGIKGAIYIKDCDNRFVTTPKPENAVAVFDLNDMDLAHAKNKSFVLIDAASFITNIVEKQVISSLFCVGGYSFSNAGHFTEVFESLKEHENLYVSHIIYAMLLRNIGFAGRRVERYVDWGTLAEWNRYRAQYATLFIDIDGTLVESSGEFFAPIWGSTSGIEDNVEVVNKLYNSGKVEVILTTSRKEAWRDVTIEQLEREGIRYHQIIFGLFHGKRVVINDYARTNPYKSCDAINLKRDSGDLKEMLEDSLGIVI